MPQLLQVLKDCITCIHKLRPAMDTHHASLPSTSRLQNDQSKGWDHCCSVPCSGVGTQDHILCSKKDWCAPLPCPLTRSKLQGTLASRTRFRVSAPACRSPCPPAAAAPAGTARPRAAPCRRGPRPAAPAPRTPPPCPAPRLPARHRARDFDRASASPKSTCSAPSCAAQQGM